MSKISLQNIDNLQNEATTVAAFNNNNALIREAVDNTLSRNGLSPNQMNASLDMNSNKIINLPDALTVQEPVTLGQMEGSFAAFSQGAVVNASFITVGSNSILQNERILTGGTNISITDGGPNSTIAVAVWDSPTFAGTVTASGGFVAAIKGLNQFGTAGGAFSTTALSISDANLILYNFGAQNWAGIGTDNAGQIWFRTGLSGTPAAALWIDTSQSAHVTGTTASTSPTTGALTVAGGVGVVGALNIGGGLIANTGTFVEFLRPDNSNQFKISYFTNDLNLRWNFNDGATIMSLTNTGDINAIGTVPTFGPGGTGTTALSMTFNGSSGAAGGARIFWAKNAVTKWQMGFSNTINGSGTSDDFLIYNQAVGPSLTFAASDSALAIGSTTASTSTTTGALKVAGGLGVAGDAFYGGKIVSTSPSAGVGYATGAGGTVTQITSKATGVTLNKVSGAITMNAAALAAATVVSFVLTNSAIAATDVLILNHISGGTPGSYLLNARCSSGSVTIDVRNDTAGSLSEAIVIQFALIKGVNA